MTGMATSRPGSTEALASRLSWPPPVAPTFQPLPIAPVGTALPRQTRWKLTACWYSMVGPEGPRRLRRARC